VRQPGARVAAGGFEVPDGRGDGDCGEHERGCERGSRLAQPLDSAVEGDALTYKELVQS
jgi:hypothetical protein